MRKCGICFLLIFFLTAFIIGCSGGGDNPMLPTQEELRAPTGAPGTTDLMGVWQVAVDRDLGTIEAVKLRMTDQILNVLGFLEPPPLTGMTINFGTLVISDPTIEVDVILTHPIPDPVFMGFDVRGVVFGAEVTNSDGLTIIPSPEFFSGVPFGYMDGLLGAPDGGANYSGLAGYKYFCDGLGATTDLLTFMSSETNLANRGVFSESPTSHTRHYVLDWTNSPQNFFTFNYAVYANYNWPVGDPPITIDDFDITTANSAEAFACDVTELSNSLYYALGTGGGSIELSVEAWDWQGDLTSVTVESPGVIAPVTGYGPVPGSTSKSYVIDVPPAPGTPTATGDLDIIITVTDVKTFGECWFMGLLSTGNSMYSTPIYNAFSYTATVTDAFITVVAPNGGEVWKGGDSEDITWTSGGVPGNVDIEYSKDNFVADINDVSTGETNDGSYTWTVAKDPSDTVRVRVSSGANPNINDVSDADFEILESGWAQTWGGTSTEQTLGVAVDSNGNSFVVGTFYGTCDFDPGTGTDMHTSNGSYDSYLVKYDSAGTFLWAHTWGGTSSDYAYGVAVDGSDNVYCTGYFYNTVDFNPGTGTYYRTSLGSSDNWVSKFANDGTWTWTRTWGSNLYDYSRGCGTDSSGNVIIAGYFRGNCDFDPNAGTFYINSGFYYWNYVLKLSSTGTFVWAKAYGNPTYSNYTYDVDVDSTGAVLTTGYFYYTADFDPGPGLQTRTSIYGADIFILKLTSAGLYSWVATFGGSNYEYGRGVCVDGSDNVYGVGSVYGGNIDYDPGPGTDWHNNPTYRGWSYLTKFNSSGAHQWARIWGSTTGYNYSYNVAADSSGNAFAHGYWSGTCDFDPGTGVDNKTPVASYDVFVNSFNSTGVQQWVSTWGGSSGDYTGYGHCIDTDSAGNIYATCRFYSTVDFDPGPGTDNHTSNGGSDSALSKLLTDGLW